MKEKEVPESYLSPVTDEQSEGSIYTRSIQERFKRANMNLKEQNLFEEHTSSRESARHSSHVDYSSEGFKDHQKCAEFLKQKWSISSCLGNSMDESLLSTNIATEKDAKSSFKNDVLKTQPLGSVLSNDSFLNIDAPKIMHKFPPFGMNSTTTCMTSKAGATHHSAKTQFLKPQNFTLVRSLSETQHKSLAPINVMYKKCLSPKVSPEINPKPRITEEKRVFMESDFSYLTPSLYAPGIKLTVHPSIRIISTVLNYQDSMETTIYYIAIESNVSWVVQKSIMEISSIIPLVQCTTTADAMSPQNRKVRDGMIQAMLNSKSTNELQHFILSCISDAYVSRSSYLLTNNKGWKAYMFKFVGKALICYEDEKVLKILILSGLEVKKINTNGFSLEKPGERIELYTTCARERDAWMADLEEYIRWL